MEKEYSAPLPPPRNMTTLARRIETSIYTRILMTLLRLHFHVGKLIGRQPLDTVKVQSANLIIESILGWGSRHHQPLEFDQHLPLQKFAPRLRFPHIHLQQTPNV